MTPGSFPSRPCQRCTCRIRPCAREGLAGLYRALQNNMPRIQIARNIPPMIPNISGIVINIRSIDCLTRFNELTNMYTAVENLSLSRGKSHTTQHPYNHKMLLPRLSNSCPFGKKNIKSHLQMNSSRKSSEMRTF